MSEGATPQTGGATAQPGSQVPAKYAGKYADYQAFRLDRLLQQQEADIRLFCLTSLHDAFTVEKKIYQASKVKIYVLKPDEGQAYKAVMKMGKFDEDSKARRKMKMMEEMSVHRYVTRAGCPYIAQVHDALHLFMKDSCYGFQVEYMPEGSLAKTFPHLCYHHRLQLCRDVAKGLKHIHSLRIAHGDIKMENVLVHIGADGQPMGKIIDFGAARVMGSKVTSGQSFGNTWIFTCPELTNPEPTCIELAASSDIWSFGILALNALIPTDHFPWRRASDVNEDFRYFREHLDSSSERSRTRNPVPLQFLGETKFKVLRPFVNYLVTNLLRMDPTRRFAIDRVIQELEGEIPGASTALELVK
eukprot:scpid88877/ scgid8969/ Serine/threonine-protein kinase SBK1; Brain-specific protein kinase BSK146; SH3-binding kinase 1